MTDLIALARESGARIVMDLPRDLDTPSKPVDVQMTPDQLATFAARIAKAPEDAQEAGDPVWLDDEGRAMIVNSHHYTPESIAALIAELKRLEDPQKSTQADWDNKDWRTWCSVLGHVMSGLFHGLDPAPPAHQAGGEGELLAEIERLKIRGAAYEEAYGIAYRATYQSHNGHWDSTMRGGLGCPECIGAREARANCDAAIQRGLQALIDRAAPHVPSALAAKGVGQ